MRSAYRKGERSRRMSRNALVVSRGSALGRAHAVRAMAMSPTLHAATVVFSANELEYAFGDATRRRSRIVRDQLDMKRLSILADRRCSRLLRDGVVLRASCAVA